MKSHPQNNFIVLHFKQDIDLKIISTSRVDLLATTTFHIEECTLFYVIVFSLNIQSIYIYIYKYIKKYNG